MTNPCVLYDEIPAHEFEQPTARESGGGATPRGSSYGCAVPGINLNDYSRTPAGKGWGAACQQSHTTITLSNELRMTCASQLAELSTLLWNEVLRRGYQLRGGVCGCYNCRYIAGTNIWSNHAWAIAFDINWDVNPYTTGTQHDIPAWVVQLANRYGFAWGGDYTGGRRDYMHFEFMGTPDQAAAATNLARAELTGQPVPPVVDAVVLADQVNLNDTGFPCGTPDGVWGPVSTQACKNFQYAAHLPADGDCGPATRAALAKVPSWRGPYYGDGGYLADRWQQKLADHGWNITVDNIWGEHSRSIIGQYQAEKGLEVTHEGNAQTWTSLHCTVN